MQLRQLHKIKKRPSAFIPKPKSVWGPFKKALIGLPKHLIKVLLALVLLSFVYIAYILSNEQYLREFNLLAQEAERDFESQLSVHPFFRFLKDHFDPSARFRNPATFNPHSLFPIPEASLAELTSKKFYRYFLTQNMPLLLVDGCSDWPALHKWSDEYLVH
jgi:hypothetical protein